MDTWAPFDEGLLRELALRLLGSGLKGSTISSYLSAVGTFAEMLGFRRPSEAWVSYAVKGLRATDAPPEKHRVLVFPYRAAFDHVDTASRTEGLTLR